MFITFLWLDSVGVYCRYLENIQHIYQNARRIKSGMGVISLAAVQFTNLSLSGALLF